MATDRLLRANAASAERPLALYAKAGNAFALTAVDARAEAGGLRVGMALADARAMLPHAQMQEADEAADAALLEHIAAWCEQFSPCIVLDPPNGIFLDIDGCAHLFGGEAALLSTALQKLKAQSFCVRGAIAPNPGAAWALARFGQTPIVEPHALLQALAELPIAALRLAPEAEALLKRLGLQRIGQIAQAPRAPFAARAGQQAMRRLDCVMGRTREALSPRRPPPPVFALRRLIEPIVTLDAILIVTADLCADLCARLDQTGDGVRLLRLHLFGFNREVRSVELGFSHPERAPATLLRLWRERLAAVAENFDAEAGFEAMRLDAAEIAQIVLRPTDLAPQAGRDRQAEARLIDTLSVRLGAENVVRLAPCEAHAPERASSWRATLAAPAHSCSPATAPADNVMRRPLTLFARAQPIEVLAETPDGPPLRFRWRRVAHDVARAEGPERIAPNWLRAPHARARDYYRVEDREGRRFWLYREGLYDEETPPLWFLHGLFA